MWSKSLKNTFERVVSNSVLAGGMHIYSRMNSCTDILSFLAQLQSTCFLEQLAVVVLPLLFSVRDVAVTSST